jgi:Glycoside-hydrolase family GH114
MERPLDNLIHGLAAVSTALACLMPACTVVRDLDDLASDYAEGSAPDAGDAEAGPGDASDLDGFDVRDEGPEPTWWQPTPGTTWQYQLTGELDTSFDVTMYGIDLFDALDEDFVTLHTDQRVVICYFTAGTYEPWREDAGEFAPSDLGSPMDDFPEERWIDVRSPTVRTIMLGRLDKARDKGCDGVAPANVDGFAYDTVFDMTASDQVEYNRFLVEAGHERGLSVGLQNAVGLVKDMLDDVDWVLDAECVEDQLCSLCYVASPMARLSRIGCVLDGAGLVGG